MVKKSKQNNNWFESECANLILEQVDQYAISLMAADEAIETLMAQVNEFWFKKHL